LLAKMCTFAALSAICLSLLAGCSKKGGGGGEASCEAVGEKFIAISRAAVHEMKGEEKKDAESMLSLLPRLKNDLIGECKKDKWSEAARKCMLAANDNEGFKACSTHIDGAKAAGRTPPSGDEPTEKKAGDEPTEKDTAGDQPTE